MHIIFILEKPLSFKVKQTKDFSCKNKKLLIIQSKQTNTFKALYEKLSSTNLLS